MKTIQVRGKTIGYVDICTDKIRYLNEHGQQVAFYDKNSDRTYGRRGELVGMGDMGMYVLQD